MDVSIIIINYKTPEMTLDCIRSVIEHTQEITYEIIVVDNGSDDNSVAILRQHAADTFRLVESGSNLGFGKANNLGNQYAAGRNIFLLNSDTLLKNNAVKILSDYLDQHSDVGVCGGNLYDRKNQPSGSYCLQFDNPSSDRKASSWISVISSIVSRRKTERIQNTADKIFQLYKDHFNFSDQIIPVAYIYGADMMLPKRVFDEMNGFDPDFFMYFEEQELSHRIKQAGYQIVSVPDAQIIHFDGGTVKNDNQFNAVQYSMRQNGRKIYYTKVFGPTGYIKYLKAKNRQLKRNLLIAMFFRRPLLKQSSIQQLECLKNIK